MSCIWMQENKNLGGAFAKQANELLGASNTVIGNYLTVTAND